MHAVAKHFSSGDEVNVKTANAAYNGMVWRVIGTQGERVVLKNNDKEIAVKPENITMASPSTTACPLDRSPQGYSMVGQHNKEEAEGLARLRPAFDVVPKELKLPSPRPASDVVALISGEELRPP